MLAGCLFSSNPHPCEPCAWCFSRPGSHRPPFSASHRNPSCGTCGGERSPVHCGVVKAERPKGTRALGVGGSHFAILFGVALEEPPRPLSPPPLLGLPSRTPVAFLEVNLRHTFLWVCSIKEEMNACFRHCPHL